MTATTTASTMTSCHWAGIDDRGRWHREADSLVPLLTAAAERHDRNGTFVSGGFEQLRARGFLSMLVPSELGGGGASHAEACAVLARLAHGCPATALAFSMHCHLIAAQVWRHRHGLAAPLLPRVASENLVLISTGASDWLTSGGVATRVDGGYRVTARKAPASGCPAGDLLVTSARVEDGPGGPKIIHFTVPFAASGVHIEETWDALGMRGTGSHTVVLERVFVSDEAVALTRDADTWHPVWSVVVGAALPLIMATYVGVAEAAVRHAIDHVASRAKRPDIAPQIGSMLNQLTAAQDTLAAMIRSSDNLRFDNSIEAAATVLSRKTIAAEACRETVRRALEVGGGTAYTRGSVIERLFRDVHGATYHPLPPAQQQRFTGRVALNLDPVD